MPRVGPFAPLTREARQGSLAQTLRGNSGDIWVFAYGSLMWDCEFPVAARRKATLQDYRRRFCVWTALARGTPENPGLSLGLLPEAGAVCQGVALRMAPAAARQGSLETLWLREMWTGVYSPVWVSLNTDRGALRALTFVVDTAHPQYAVGIPVATAAKHIATARGKFGPCREYFDETMKVLMDQGIGTDEFAELIAAVNGANPDRV